MTKDDYFIWEMKNYLNDYDFTNANYPKTTTRFLEDLTTL